MSPSRKVVLHTSIAHFALAAVAVLIAGGLAYGQHALQGQVSSTGIRIVDDSNTQLFRVTTGNVFTKQVETNAYHGDRSVAQYGTATSVSWNFGDVPAGNYDVFVTWPNLTGNDSDIPYNVMARNADESVTALLGFTIDQTKDPVNDHNAGGRPFQKVGTVKFAGKSMFISLRGTPREGKYFEFDAVMIKSAVAASSSSYSSSTFSSSSSFSSLPKCPADYPLCTAQYPHMDCQNGGMPRDEYSTIACTHLGSLGKCYRAVCPTSSSSSSTWTSSSSSSVSSLPSCPKDYPYCSAPFPFVDCPNGGMPNEEYSTINCMNQGKVGRCYRVSCPVSSSSSSSFISSRSSSSYSVVIDPCPPFCPPTSSSSSSYRICPAVVCILPPVGCYYSKTTECGCGILICSSSSSSSSFVDLSLSMTGPSTIVREQEVTYRFTVRNEGTATEPQVTFTDPLQGSFLLTRSMGATCKQADAYVKCLPFLLAPKETRVIELSFVVPQIVDCVTKTVTHQGRVVATMEDPSRLANNVNTPLKSTVLCSASSSSSSTPITMKVISPNGGETYTAGTNFEIRWNRTGQPVRIGLVDSRFETNPEAILGWINSGNAADSSTLWDGTVVSDAAGTVIWKVSDLSKGPFKIIATTGGCIWSQTGTCNTDLSDGYFKILPAPSSSSSSSSSQPAPAALAITTQLLASADTLVKNQKNVNMFRFEARASDSQDVLLTQINLESVLPTAINASNYTLFVDTDNDTIPETIVQSGVFSQSHKISFVNLMGGGVIIPKNGSRMFEVHADVASNFVSPNSLQLRLATSMPNYVAAEARQSGAPLVGISTNGVCSSPSCYIFVSTADSTRFTLVSQGDLYVTKDSTPLRSRQLLGGTLAEEALRLQFRAEYEDIDVTRIRIINAGDATSIDRLELYRVGQTTPFANATVGGCMGQVGANVFCATIENRELVIPKGTDVDVLVRPRIKSDAQGAIAGSRVELSMGNMGNIGNTQIIPAVEARGVLSSNALLTNNNDNQSNGEVFLGTTNPGPNIPIIGLVNPIVFSKIVSITNGHSDPNGTAIPEGPNRIVGAFRFAAAQNANSVNGLNRATPRAIIFNVIATNMSLDQSSFRAMNYADATTLAPCFAYNNAGVGLQHAASGSFIVACNLTGINTEMSSGQAMTLGLLGNVQHVQVGGNTSTMQVSFTKFSSSLNTTFAPASSHIYWLDKDSAPTGTNFFWIDYPTDTVTSTTYVSG